MGIRDIPVDLYLAGHTHGGQIRIPFGGPIIIPSRVPRSWARGFRELGATRLNVSAGIGCEHASRLPSMRLFCPPEMTVFSADRTAANKNGDVINCQSFFCQNFFLCAFTRPRRGFFDGAVGARGVVSCS